MNKQIPTRELNIFAEASQVFTHMDPAPFDAVSPPIFQTSLFTFDSYDEIADVFAGKSDRYIYSRGDNPTVKELERLVASLEGAEAARGFSSGTAAIASAIVPFVEAGDRIVAVENCYSDAFRLFEKILRKFGVETAYVDGKDTQAMLDALPGAALVYLESPTSMVFDVQDIAMIGHAARELGVISVIDNSWATPIFCKPLSYHIDLVIHAASKYMGGHSDTVAGLVAGSQKLIDRINHDSYHYLGGKLSPFDAWLVLRGMRTLPLRMQRHMENGLTIAGLLDRHDKVTRVRHPAFQPHPGNACFSGYGGLFSFDVDPSVDVPSFVNALSHIRLGVSWGGPETLVVPALAALQLPSEGSSFQRFGTSPHTIRLAVGLEDPGVLWRDLEQALERASCSA